MSERLFKKSTPRVAPSCNREEWADGSELCFDESDFLNYKGVTKSFKPIIQDNEHDVKRLKRFCCHILFFATFWHSTVHNRQGIDLTNLAIASLAPQNHALNSDGEWDRLANTPSASASKQLAVATTLVDYEGDLLVRPNEQVYPPFIQNLLARREAFEEIGYDIDKIMTCVEI
ncbi:MAG: hypothetical protein ACK5MA_01020 [Parachlamydiaceae bacterium]